MTAAAPARVTHPLEPWFAPFALINGSALGLVPILLPLAAARDGLGHVGFVMGAFSLGAIAAPIIGSLVDRHQSYRSLAAACATGCALSLWLFALAAPALQPLLAFVHGAGFAGAVTIANLLIVERRPQFEWNERLGWLEATLSVGQGAALALAASLTGLSVRSGLLAAAFVPAAAVPLALLLIPRMHPPADHSARRRHRLRSAGQVGEWGPASPSRAHHLHQWRHPLDAPRRLLSGGFGWMIAGWMPAYGRRWRR